MASPDIAKKRSGAKRPTSLVSMSAVANTFAIPPDTFVIPTEVEGSAFL
jgi:hypothetical protein